MRLEVLVQDLKLADHLAPDVRQERVVDVVRLRERSHRVRRVVAHLEDRVPRAFERRKDPLQLDQLRLAVRSPDNAAVERDDRSSVVPPLVEIDDVAPLIR